MREIVLYFCFFAIGFVADCLPWEVRAATRLLFGVAVCRLADGEGRGFALPAHPPRPAPAVGD